MILFFSFLFVISYTVIITNIIVINYLLTRCLRHICRSKISRYFCLSQLSVVKMTKSQYDKPLFVNNICLSKIKLQNLPYNALKASITLQNSS